MFHQMNMDKLMKGRAFREPYYQPNSGLTKHEQVVFFMGKEAALSDSFCTNPFAPLSHEYEMWQMGWHMEKKDLEGLERT